MHYSEKRSNQQYSIKCCRTIPATHWAHAKEGIQKSLFPCLEVTERMEGNFTGKLFSGTWNLWLGDETTRIECLTFVDVQEVDDVVGNFW